MTKKILFVFLLCFFSSVSAYAYSPNENEVYKILVSKDRNGGFESVYETLSSDKFKEELSNTENFITFGVWLRDMHFNSQKDMRYGFLYADHMKQLSSLSSGAVSLNNKGTASMAYFISYLKLINAISRCDDNGVGLKARMQWASKPSEYKSFFSTIPEEKKAGYFDAILKHVENANKSDSKDKWVCKDGVGAMSRAIQAGEDQKPVEDPERLGQKTFVVDTSNYVEFISNDEWKKKRSENIKKLKEYLLGK